MPNISISISWRKKTRVRTFPQEKLFDTRFIDKNLHKYNGKWGRESRTDERTLIYCHFWGFVIVIWIFPANSTAPTDVIAILRLVWVSAQYVITDGNDCRLERGYWRILHIHKTEKGNLSINHIRIPAAYSLDKLSYSPRKSHCKDGMKQWKWGILLEFICYIHKYKLQVLSERNVLNFWYRLLNNFRFNKIIKFSTIDLWDENPAQSIQWQITRQSKHTENNFSFIPKQSVKLHEKD